jgi:hypothetical protein
MYFVVLLHKCHRRSWDQRRFAFLISLQGTYLICTSGATQVKFGSKKLTTDFVTNWALVHCNLGRNRKPASTIHHYASISGRYEWSNSAPHTAILHPKVSHFRTATTICVQESLSYVSRRPLGPLRPLRAIAPLRRPDPHPGARRLPLPVGEAPLLDPAGPLSSSLFVMAADLNPDAPREAYFRQTVAGTTWHPISQAAVTERPVVHPWLMGLRQRRAVADEEYTPGTDERLLSQRTAPSW